MAQMDRMSVKVSPHYAFYLQLCQKTLHFLIGGVGYFAVVVIWSKYLTCDHCVILIGQNGRLVRGSVGSLNIYKFVF
jgi:hypothetical protein